jgi:type I restriction enzyme R subunit
MSRNLKTTKQVLRLIRKGKTRHSKQKTSILDDIDFELELIHRDQINVAYLEIVSAIKRRKKELRQLHKETIIDLLGGDIS